MTVAIRVALPPSAGTGFGEMVGVTEIGMI
jgi:hypothetical protein